MNMELYDEGEAIADPDDDLNGEDDPEDDGEDDQDEDEDDDEL